MVQYLSINFFSWISSIFVGFFKSSRFFCVTLYMTKLFNEYFNGYKQIHILLDTTMTAYNRAIPAQTGRTIIVATLL